MPKPTLKPEFKQLAGDIQDTMTAGLKRWRQDLDYPQSSSDWRACIDALLQMYEVKRRPIALKETDLWIEGG